MSNILLNRYEELLEAGWNDDAINVYLNVAKEISHLPYSKRKKEIKNLRKQLKSVGSELYCQMLEEMLKTTTNTEILALIFKQLGAILDKYDFLQLVGQYQLYNDLKPTDRFHQLFCDILQGAVAEGQKITKEIHQFRSYLDRQAINFIRRYKVGKMRDVDALALFAEKENVEIKYEASRLHNKFPKNTTYPEYYPEQLSNIKYLINFHVEFIVAPTGEFISQWNVLEKKTKFKSIFWFMKQIAVENVVESNIKYYKKKYKNKEEWEQFSYQIVNTESFNYANNYKEEKAMHELLDMDPPEFMDSKLRKQVSEEWEYPIKEIVYRKDKEINKYQYGNEQKTNEKLLNVTKI